MKFARYLEDTQTPEWKKAYIDYRLLKKRITAIRRAQAQSARSDGSSAHGTPSLIAVPLAPPPSVRPADPRALSAPSQVFVDSDEHSATGTDTAHTSTTHVAPLLRRRSSAHMLASLRAPLDSPAMHSPRSDPRRAWLDRNLPPLMTLLPQLAPVQRAFFETLDEELDKVESFYCAREREVRARTAVLEEQLQELKDHRRVFHETYPRASIRSAWFSFPATFPLSLSIPFPRLCHRRATTPPAHPPRASRRRRRERSADTQLAHTNGAESLNVAANGELEDKETIEGVERSRAEEAACSARVRIARENHPPPHVRMRAGDSGTGSGAGSPRRSADSPTPATRFDPEEYQDAKKKLKKAVLECYRGLEVLNHYRTLNLIGFRKALKKFEKVTLIPAQQSYTIEKIEPSAISSGATVDGMLRDMEDLFAARFARGDKKRARARLRGGSQYKSHHFSTFRTGSMVGLAVPALADGIYRSFQSDARAAIPGWDGLLFVYGIFLVPVVFSLLVGINVLVWANARINYVFIFELDVRTRLDHREYFEIPALLLCTLCYAFWLSFARIGAGNVDPTTWPLIWLAWAAFVVVEPLPVLFKPSRWWLLRIVGKLLTSGMRRVEFEDFWMGDQFCSLVFTLSNLALVGCAYSGGLESWEHCTGGRWWGPSFALASLPLVVRVVQSIKRWVDSRLITHLINAGKYASGILNYLFYYLWREHGGGRGRSFVVWCIFATNYSLYASSWDLLMDWSLLRPHARYPLLRSELLYPAYIPLYYLAIIANVLIRFIWVIYIPENGPHYMLRTFIAAMLEMSRRWQWNFIRLENEHLGNMDQYRVTREVPLPYSFDDPSHESDGDEDDAENISIRSGVSWRKRQTATAAKDTGDIDRP